jgi:tetratricopeptide (TPR) repeat protein
VEIARRYSVEGEASGVLRELLTGAGRFPGAPALDGEAELLRSLGQLAGADNLARTLLVSYAVAGTPREREIAAAACGVSEATLAEALARAGGAWDPTAFIATTSLPRSALPPASDAAPLEPDALESELATLEQRLVETPNDAALLEAFGRASLALARQRAASGSGDSGFLFTDAERGLAAASAARPTDVDLLLLRARVAYEQGRYDDELAFGRKSLELLTPLDRAEDEALLGIGGVDAARWKEAARASAEPPQRHEALRWTADASARLLWTRAGGDPLTEIENIARGARTFALAVACPRSIDADWVSLASYFGALGRRREELALLQVALDRYPESAGLRQAFHTVLGALGRPDLAASKSQWIAERHPDSAAADWYAGYALMLHADWLRRAEAADAAIVAYRRAAEAFERSRAREPGFADTAEHYIALSALGRGFAHLLAQRQAEAAEALAEGLRIRPAIGAVRDGLDREAVDLLDGALEWRASGESRVDPIALAERLEAADPGNPTWDMWIADSELREALRADGRSEMEAGDRHLERSIAVARRAVAVADKVETRRCLAQSATIAAERDLSRARVEPARRRLQEAAPLIGESAPAADASEAELVELASRLRAALGEARPVFRPGR